MSGTDQQIRILFVEDEAALAEAAATYLEQEDARFEVETAVDAVEAEGRLAEVQVDCIVSDYEMPGRNGVEFLEEVRQKAPDLPFILYTGKGSEEIASEAISAGVTDYLQKGVGTGQYAVLANRIGNAVEARRSSLRHEETKERLAAQNRALRRLYEISADQTLAFEEKIRQCLELGQSYLGTEIGVLANIDRAAGEWSVVEVCGGGEQITAGQSIELSETYCRQTIEQDEIVALTDAPEQGWSEDPAFCRWGFKTYIGKSVWVDGDPYGTLCFGDRTSRDASFDEADRTFVELASRWISSELERLDHERQLERRSRYTDDLLDAFDDVFYVLDTEGYLKRCNESLPEVTGYSDAELEGRHATDFFAASDHESVRTAIKQGIETGHAQLEVPLLTREGKSIPYEFSGSRVTGPEGKVRLVGIGRDITERKHRERALIREREQLDTLFKNLPNPVVRGELGEQDAFVLDVNPAFERTFGYRAEEIEGTPLHDLVLPDDAQLEEQAAKFLQHLHEEGELHTEVRRETIQGMRDFRLDVGGRLDVEPQEGFAIYTDVTEQRERERRRERRYEAIFNHSYQFTGLLDADGTLIEVNQAALEIGGLEEQDVLGEPFWETYWWQVDEETRRRAKEAVERAADGEFVRFETSHKAEDGTIVVDFSMRPVTDEDGEVIYMLPEGRNITEFKALEERERALERQNKRLDEFANVLSHDLRNPLNSAVNHLQLARVECDCPDLDAVGRAHDRMKDLIEDVLTLAREGETVRATEEVDLAELFERVASGMQTGEATLVAETDRVIRADRRRLQRLLENLVRNAVEHGGQEVTIRIGDLAEGFYLEDNGPGIPEEIRGRVFEPGYSTSETGTGFGLNIAREIAEAHEWRMELTDSAEGGARFEIVAEQL